MFSRRSPENVFASVVVCDERMLQTKPICNRANAGPFESSFGELRNGSVQDGASRLKRALLFGSLARTPPLLHGRFQLCAFGHVHWLTRLLGRRQEHHALTTIAATFCCWQRRSLATEHAQRAALWQVRRHIRRC